MLVIHKLLMKIASQKHIANSSAFVAQSSRNAMKKIERKQQEIVLV